MISLNGMKKFGSFNLKVLTLAKFIGCSGKKALHKFTLFTFWRTKVNGPIGAKISCVGIWRH